MHMPVRHAVAVIAVLLAALSGCARQAPPPIPVQLTEAYDPAAFAWSERPGRGRIEGSALMRTMGGEARTCAATSVDLLPATPYTEERVRILYGTGDRGYRPLRAPMLQFIPETPTEEQLADRHGRQAFCDAQGEFEFDDLPAGSYFVIAEVVWGAPSVNGLIAEGGVLMQRVGLDPGQTERVVLTSRQ